MMTKAYKAEFEETSITLEELTTKYQLTPKTDLKGSEHWIKRTQPQTQTFLQPTSSTQTLVPNIDSKREPVDKQTLLDDILDFKKQAISHALAFMKDNAKYAEVKEFKDIVSIITSIESTLVDKKDIGPTINILVQNLTEKFKDDC